MTSTPRLFVIVGTPGSGKDLLIRAVNDLGTLHAAIVPKHTSRAKRSDDGEEMICPDHPDYALEGCNIQYENYGDKYGIKSVEIWEGLREGTSQVAVVSDLGAIRSLQRIFGEFLVLVYVHSKKNTEEYRCEAAKYGGDAEYVERRVAEYQHAFDLYRRHFLAFSHVLIYAGLDEDLYDQIFRLFRAYERGDLPYTTARPVASARLSHKTSAGKVAASAYTERDNQCLLEVASVPQITVTTSARSKESRIFHQSLAQPA